MMVRALEPAPHLVEVEATPLEMLSTKYGMEFFLHKWHWSLSWRVAEARSGCAVSDGLTKESAIRTAHLILEKNKDQLLARVNQMIETYGVANV